MRRAGLILFWSVLAAAFIGPGTVTTAAKAGASYGYSLLWALCFSTIACLLLQEMSARSFLVTGLTLGERIASLFPSPVLRGILAAAIGIGGVAYEAGNLLGAVAGIRILFPDAGEWLTSVAVFSMVGLAAVVLLASDSQKIAKRLGMFVVVMGIVFLSVVVMQDHRPMEILASGIQVSFPPDSGWLILGLVGTTIVPYNLFLGGSIGQGQSIKDMRLGLSIAIILGGLISMAVLLVASKLDGPFSFQSLYQLLVEELGSWGGIAVGCGLVIAGFTSAVTAPWASSLAVTSLFPAEHGSQVRGRIVWMIVLAAGLLFGISGVKPIPVIILAQALNGLALPIVACLLLLMMNQGLGKLNNGRIQNLAGLSVLGIATLLSLLQLTKLVFGQIGDRLPETAALLPYVGIIVVGILLVVGDRLRKLNR